MPLRYVVEAGDCFVSLGKRFGFSWETLWNLPENSELRRRRREPSILLPGDTIVIPDINERVYSRATEACHSFMLTGGVTLRMRLMAPPEPTGVVELGPPPDDDQLSVTYDEPTAPASQPDVPQRNTAYQLRFDGTTRSGKTVGDGYLEESLPATVSEATLVVAPGSESERVIPVRIGHLDPVDTPSGAADRLNNLGLWDGSRPNEITEEFAAALGRFQRNSGLDATGRLDQPTKDLLLQLHGS